MWEYEHSIVPAATPASIWQLYSDVSTWPEWDAGIAAISIDGPFAAGTMGMITPSGQASLPFTTLEADPERGFVDETEIRGAGILIRFEHRIVALPDGRSRLTHSVAIRGPIPDAVASEIGAGVSAGIPQTMATLAQQAAARDGRQQSLARMPWR